MKRLTLTFVCLSASAVIAAGTPSAAPAQTPKSTGFAARIESLAESMLPKERVDRMMGFFAPVVKKYMPTFQRFNTEYLAADKKIPVIEKYLPEADKAVAEAKAMKVPAKYEAEKAQYIGEVESFLNMTRMSMVFAKKFQEMRSPGKTK